MKISSKFQPLWVSDDRYYVMTGGRGSSKSFTTAVRMLNLTYEPNEKILYTRYTLTSASTSIIPEFIEKIELLGSHADFRITKDEIINLKTMSSIVFKGIRTSSGNQTAALKSLQGITTWVLDEAEELTDEETFDKIDLSVRVRDRQNRVILILNPSTKEHWIYKRFFSGNLVKAGSNTSKNGVTYIHTTYKDNIENLPDSFVNTIMEMKRKRPDKYEHQILGGWLEKAEGVIFKNWKMGSYVETDQTVYGQDFGFKTDPTTLVKIAIDKQARKMWVKEIYGRAGMSTNDIATSNNRTCGNSLIICDSAEPRLINELKQYGNNIRPTIKKIGSILSGIALMQDYQIIVDRDSTNIVKELNNYAWKQSSNPNSDKTVPIDRFNHYVDAMRYALMYLAQGVRSGSYHIR